MRRALLVLAGLAAPLPAQNTFHFTHADTLRGSNGPARAWWDVAFYDLHVRVSPGDSTISGWNGIAYRVLRPARELQIDLQDPLQVDSVLQGRTRLRYRRDGSAYFVTLPVAPARGTVGWVTVYYHGRPVVATNPPWDGGFTWAKDSLGHTWVATSNEGVGASVWWPNKDYLADEPDSQRIAITVPDALFDVSNGRLRSVTPLGDGTTTWEWFVASPINNYDVAVDAGRLAHFGGVYDGEAGPLTLDFWPLAIHLDTARVQFQQVTAMLQCFEDWFGPYPFYADGYKLVEAPHLGMEHQSAVAYGNHYKNGYLGRDLSGTGTGLGWDFIIVHESAHEWWGNNITMQDQADMWIHEGFANYAENLFVECQQGKAAGARYVIGTRRGIQNKEPIIAPYGVNAEPPGDQYPKGGNLLHTIRQVVADDAKWRGILRGLNREFWHRTVTTADVEGYISRAAGIDLAPVFQQYLRTTEVPLLEYQLAGDTLSYRWANVVPGFAMPVRVTVADTVYALVRPTVQWQKVPAHLSRPELFRVDENFYVEAKPVLAGKGAP